MLDLLSAFKEYIHKECLLRPDDVLLLAVSGGIDSVVLCELCYQAGYPFVMAHCNFQLRGEESFRDEHFVKALAEKYQKTVLVRRFDTEVYAAENKLSIQVAARELRYDWFYSLLNKKNDANASPTLVVTAHHANDNIETVLMNYFKGTGVTGMRGMLPKQKRLIRPLLFATRQQIEHFAKEQQLDFVEDSSNASVKYTRNFVRHKLIPEIQQVFLTVNENILDNIARAREVELLYQQAVTAHKKKLIEQQGGETAIAVEKLRKVIPLKTILYEIIKDWGFASRQVDEVIALLDSDSGRYVLSASHRILRNRNWLLISEREQEAHTVIVVEKAGTETGFAGGKLIIHEKEFDYNKWKPGGETNLVQIDAKNIEFPLMVRKWKEGDYFYPLGMQKKKKLARFFIDQKLSLPEKEQVWVVESNKKIVWVINRRIDERFKITAITKKILELKVLDV